MIKRASYPFAFGPVRKRRFARDGLGAKEEEEEETKGRRKEEEEGEGAARNHAVTSGVIKFTFWTLVQSIRKVTQRHLEGPVAF